MAALPVVSALLALILLLSRGSDGSDPSINVVPLSSPVSFPKGVGNSTISSTTSFSWPDGWKFTGARDLTYRSPEYLDLFVAETQLYNDIVLSFLPLKLRQSLPHVAQTWLRNYVAGTLVYFATGGLWCLYIYQFRASWFFPTGEMPSTEAMLKQIRVALLSMPAYVSLPTLSEHMVEMGWTRCYAQVDEVGMLTYLGLFAAYMMFVEFGIYWMHRELHDIKPLYKWLHATHHVYNKQNTLSPFAGLAFNPIDGILQACPHVIALFVLPTHFFTHEAMLFLEAVWTANIHDNIDEGIFPFMGAAYHTIHHTTYRHNYGHYTIFMDWLFGTLREPEKRQAAAKKAA
eukprot:TRINITY_DN14861_c0_g1_i1.p1 TRINITY_DN14861_c0_g1~~TRINITY_DN14861_c0_g1_i1.p1  ORF type:complete len:345 (-),score=30.28 TRINITY_DN14861_c0_g1_i1:607-1641(-)